MENAEPRTENDDDDMNLNKYTEKAQEAVLSAQRQASELLGDEGIALLDKAARKLGGPRADR